MKQDCDTSPARPQRPPTAIETDGELFSPESVARAIAYAQAWAAELATRTDREGRAKAQEYLSAWLAIATARLGKEAVDATAQGQAFIFVGVDGSRYSFRPLPRTP